MNKYEISKIIENFAPPETQEDWDCSGWGVENEKINDISKIMLCLTVTDDVISQAREKHCEMIISHHPLFFVPLNWKYINIYSAHTNLDKANGGTTDTLIKTIGFEENKIECIHPYIRLVDLYISVNELSEKIKKISPNARIINNFNTQKITRIAFCSGSGSEFIEEGEKLGADCFITGDLKFHTALDCKILTYDIGHFESEILILPEIEKLLKNTVEIIYAKESSPFKQI